MSHQPPSRLEPVAAAFPFPAATGSSYKDRFYENLERLVLPSIEALTDKCSGCGAATWPCYPCGNC